MLIISLRGIMQKEMRLGRACRAVLDAEHSNQAFREGKTAWDSQDRDAGRAQWAAKLFGKESGDILRRASQINGQGATKRAFWGGSRAAARQRSRRAATIFEQSGRIFANILSYIAIIIHSVSQD